MAERSGENLIFLVSQPRSGSTLTQKILGGHADILTWSEPWIMLHPLYAFRQRGIHTDYNHGSYVRALREFLAAIDDNGHQRYVQALRSMYLSLYQAHLEKHGKRLFLDKTPRYYLILPELREVFPRARFIVLIRNPLAVLCSIIRSWTKQSWANLAYHKGDLVDAPDRLIDFTREQRPDTIVVHYEDIVEQPDATCRWLCDRLGLSYEPEMLAYGDRGQEHWTFGDQERVYANETVSSGNHVKWTRALADPQIWRLVHDYLALLGAEKIQALGYAFEEQQQIVQEHAPADAEEVLSRTMPLATLLDNAGDYLLENHRLRTRLGDLKRELAARSSDFAKTSHALHKQQLAVIKHKADAALRMREFVRARSVARERAQKLKRSKEALQQVRAAFAQARRKVELVKPLLKAAGKMGATKPLRSPLKAWRAYRRLVREQARVQNRLDTLPAHGEAAKLPSAPQSNAPEPTAGPGAASTGDEVSPSTTFYVFYHDPDKLAHVTGGLVDERFCFIDLNTLPLPDFLRVEGLEGRLNRALFSEYLGLLHVQPQTELVGFFTYSVPLKFSYEWAHFTKGYQTFLPAIRFEDVARGRYEPNKLYAVELNDPQRKFPDEIKRVHDLFRVGGERISPLAPYKGSIILETRVFLEFQAWFGPVCADLMRSFSWRTYKKENSPFSSGPIARKSEQEKKVDRMRHSIGDLMERATAYYFGQAYPDAAKIGLGKYLRDSQLDPALREVVEKHRRDNLVILAFANHDYAEVLDNWLSAMHRLGISNIVVVALDEELHDSLKNRDVGSYLLRCGPNLAQLWLKRLQVFKDINDLGIDFIHSDTDAVWLKNPLPEFFTPRDRDIIMSQGTIWPQDVHDAWGFVLCCGLFFVKASRRMSYFLHRMLEDAESSRDDQVSFNRVVAADQIQWSVRDAYQVPFKGTRVKCSRQQIDGTGENLTLAVLPQHLFQRIHMPQEEAYVKHILSPKTSESKTRILKKLGCYLLGPAGPECGSNSPAGPEASPPATPAC